MEKIITPKLTVEFKLTNELGDEFSLTTKAEVSEDLYGSDLDFIGEQLNIFLKQCGYIRNNDCILMEDLTEDERYDLSCTLDKLRENIQPEDESND